MRSLESVRAVVDSGAARVILGTAAFRDPIFLDEAVANYRERVVVSIDARAGRVAAAGWTEDTDLTVEDALIDLQRRGVSSFVYSNIERDGMLSGPDLDGARAFAARLEGSFVYSGWGRRAGADLRALAELREPKLSGVIVGKAIYEQRFGVDEAQALFDTLS